MRKFRIVDLAENTHKIDYAETAILKCINIFQLAKSDEFG